MKRFALGIVVATFFMSAAGAAGVVALQRGWSPPTWVLNLLQPGAGAFCAEHGVPEKFCTVCHAELQSSLEMCREHGLPEEICTICDPAREQKYGLKMLCDAHHLPRMLCPKCRAVGQAGDANGEWCMKHEAPQALCTRCRPDLSQSIDMCSEHGVPSALCTICRPELAVNFSLCKAHRLPQAFCPQCAATGQGNSVEADSEPYRSTRAASRAASTLSTVRLASDDIAEKVGIEVHPVAQADLSDIVSAPGEVAYDETQLAHVRPRVAGFIREVQAQTGDRVTRGQLLAVIDSSELGQAKADYLAAMPLVELWTETLARNRGLSERGLVAEKFILEAETELRRVKAETIKVSQRLRNLGLDRQQIAELADEPEDERNLLKIAAPLDGTIVRRNAVGGESVESTTELFSVARLDHVWAHLDVFERDLERIRVGQEVVFRVAGLAPRQFMGKVIWVDSEVHERTRTIRVRAQLENADTLLRAHMFGQGEIRVRSPRQSLIVPRDAVQWEGTSFVVFVRGKRLSEFEPRRVLIGRNDGHYAELAWAELELGDNVATTGSFLLKTELMRDAIGAGCCGED